MKRLFRGERMTAREAKEDYLTYRSTRRHHDDVPFLLGVGVVCMMLSVAAALMAWGQPMEIEDGRASCYDQSK